MKKNGGAFEFHENDASGGPRQGVYPQKKGEKSKGKVNNGKLCSVLAEAIAHWRGKKRSGLFSRKEDKLLAQSAGT